MENNLVRIRADKIKLPEIMMRRFVDEVKLEQLANSIRKYGIIVPIIVQEKNGKAELVAGFRRLMAAGKINSEYMMPVITMRKDINPEAVKTIENMERENVGAVDEGEYYQEVMVARGWTQKDLAREIGMSEAYISQRIATITWDLHTKELVRGGELKWSVARELQKIDDEVDRRRLIIVAVKSGVTPAVAAEWKRDSNRLRSEQMGELDLPHRKSEPEKKNYVPCQCCENAVEVNMVKFVRVCSDCEDMILHPPAYQNLAGKPPPGSELNGRR